MEEFEKRIKQALDNHLFNQLNLTETEAVLFAATIKQNSMKRKSKKRLILIVPAIAVCLVLIISSVLLRVFITDTKDVAASIEEKAEHEFGKPVVIPALEEYPITFSAITKPDFLDKPSDLTISYGNSKGELEPAFRSAELRKKWEKEQESILLYGPFNGKKVISIEYRPGQMELGGSGGLQDKIINGMPVQYEHFKRDAGEFVFAIINGGGGGYSVQMIITKEFTLSDSEKVLEEITRQLKGW